MGYRLNPQVRRGRTGRPFERVKAQVYRDETHCWLCHQPVNQALPHNHPLARSVDHIVPLSHGGDPLDRSNCRLAHRKCNTIRANQLRAKPTDRGYLALDPASL